MLFLLVPVAGQASDLARPPALAGSEAAVSDWGLITAILNQDIVGRLKFTVYRPADNGDGFRLVRLFGENGPSLRASASMPEVTYSSLRAGGGRRIGALTSNDLAEAFLFVQKRW